MNLKRLVISPEQLVYAMQAGKWEVIGGALPEDAMVIRVAVNSLTGMIELVVESQSFELVLNGQKIPEMDPVKFQRLL